MAPRKKPPTDIPAQPSSDERSREQSRLALRKKVKMFYDLQALRLQTNGRTHERPDVTPITLHEADVKVLAARGNDLERAEKEALKDIEDHLQTVPMFNQVLSDKVRFRGIGPTMAGVILAEFDIYKEDTPSKMWAFAGLRPMPAHRCTKCHSVVEIGEKHGTFAVAKCERAGVVMLDTGVYESGKAQRPIKGEKLAYNAWLRMKLVGVLGPVLLKLNSPWRKHYDDYKHRKTSAEWGRNDGHRHQASIRYMVKMLLQEIWREWRKVEGLPVRDPYAVEFQNRHKHGELNNGFSDKGVESGRTSSSKDPLLTRVLVDEAKKRSDEMEIEEELRRAGG